MTHIFFTDRDLGKAFPQILLDAGIEVERHVDHFPDSAPDELWLSEIGRLDWLAITHDRNIRYKANERDAVMRAGVGLFILVGKSTTRQLAHVFVNTLPRIERFLTKHRRPFIAKIYKPSPSEVAIRPNHPGRVELWLSHSQWQKMLAN